MKRAFGWWMGMFLLLAAPRARADLLLSQIAEHAVFFDGQGIPELCFRPDGTKKLECKTLHRDDYMTQVVMPLLEAIQRDTQTTEIMVFLHGGMTDHESAMVFLERLLEGWGSNRPHDLKRTIYPIVIAWDTGFGSSYAENLLLIRDGIRTPGVGIPTSPFFLTQDVARGLVRIPINVWRGGWFTVKGWLCDEQDPRGLLQTYCGDAALSPRHHRMLSVPGNAAAGQSAVPGADMRIALGKDQRGNLQRGLDLAGGVPWLPLKMGGRVLVDIMGPGAWENMVRRSSVLFNHEDNSWLEVSAHCSEDCAGPSSRSALRLLLKLLFQQYAPPADGQPGPDAATDAVTGPPTPDQPADLATPSTAKPITLVGHSMGGILLNRLLHNYQQVEFKRVVYMAAANSVREYEEAAFPYLYAHPRTQLFHLVLHPVAEDNERLDWISPVVGAFTGSRPGLENGAKPYHWVEPGPRGSLLVWLDEVFAQPKDPLDRRAGRLVNLLPRLVDTPRQMRGQIAVKSFDVGWDLMLEQPQRHGGFSSYPFWEDAFVDPFAGTAGEYWALRGDAVVCALATPGGACIQRRATAPTADLHNRLNVEQMLTAE